MEGGCPMITDKQRKDLFCDTVPTPKTPRAAKQVVGASETETVNQLANIRAATVHFELYSAIAGTAEKKLINIYVFRRARVGVHYRPRNRYFYTVVAVRAGTPKATQIKAQTGIIAQISNFPCQVNHHKSSKQYKLLSVFAQDIASIPAPQNHL